MASPNFPDYPFQPQRFEVRPGIAMSHLDEGPRDGEVVLIHGDTHRYRVDRPLLDPETRRPMRNFTRIEVYGSPSVNWVRVRVERVDGKVQFEATPGS